MDLPFQDLWLPAVRNRMVLFANHVLTGCPPAVERLRAHAGKAVRVDVSGWPGLIPVPPPLMLRITPAGLFEGVETAEAASGTPDLNVRIDAAAPRRRGRERASKGGLPPMSSTSMATARWRPTSTGSGAELGRWDPGGDAASGSFG